VERRALLEQGSVGVPETEGHVLGCDIKTDSEIFKYFMKEDKELLEKYDRGPISDESL